MELTWVTYLIVCPLVFLAGLIDSVAGGGGLISLPAYMAAGLSPLQAAGTNKMSACLGTVASTGRFVRDRKVDWKAGIFAALGAFPGSWLGALLQQHSPQENIRLLMIVAIPLVAVVVLRKKAMNGRCLVSDAFYRPMAFAIGLYIGFYDGLIGPGTGTFLILLVTMTLGMEAGMASGTAKIVNLTSNVAALASYLARSRNMKVSAEQILIGSGAEYLYGLNVLAVGRERLYALENPSYEKIRKVYCGMTPRSYSRRHVFCRHI